MKEDDAGEVPVAFVVRSKESNLSEDEIKQFVSKQVMIIWLCEDKSSFDDLGIPTLIVCVMQVVFYKRINKVFFTDSIPKAPSGKILRKDLRARLANGLK